MKEIWKDIPGWEGYYQASNLGRIKSLIRDTNACRKEKILKPTSVHGYHHVSLCKNGKYKNFRVHRLILVTFKEPSNLQCNHKDCNKSNNQLSNLEYVTAKENTLHAWEKGKCNVDHLKKLVDQFTKDGNYINTFDSIMDAERELGIANSSISQCCNGKLKTAGNFKWRFSDKRKKKMTI